MLFNWLADISLIDLYVVDACVRVRMTLLTLMAHKLWPSIDEEGHFVAICGLQELWPIVDEEGIQDPVWSFSKDLLRDCSFYIPGGVVSGVGGEFKYML